MEYCDYLDSSSRETLVPCQIQIYHTNRHQDNEHLLRKRSSTGSDQELPPQPPSISPTGYSTSSCSLSSSTLYTYTRDRELSVSLENILVGDMSDRTTFLEDQEPGNRSEGSHRGDRDEEGPYFSDNQIKLFEDIFQVGEVNYCCTTTELIRSFIVFPP